jgi:uncharacterized protein YndB with AHSA1/START domain
VTTFAPNPDLDLVLERTVAVAPELVWKAWTTPELVARWFAPRPWSVAACEIGLPPAGWGRRRRLHRGDQHRAGRRRHALHGDRHPR